MESTIKNPKIQRTRCDGGGDGDARDKGDRITNLPEPIIHHIFSFLETIDVIRASAVSRKWRYLWTSMPYLHFNIHTVWLDPLKSWCLNTVNEKFKDFVNWVLMSQGFTNMQSFRLSCLNFEDDYSVNRWINVAARRNVKEIDLTMDSDKPIELPHCLVTCESLAVLKLNLRGRVLRLPSFVGFSKLKSLELAWVELTDEVLARNLISSCPLLENLSIKWCIFRGFKVVDISAVNLKKLIIDNLASNEGLNEGLCNSTLKIDCPNLVSFNYLNPPAQDISFQNPSSLDNAFIYIDHEDFDDALPLDEVLGNFMCKILTLLCNAKVLKLNLVFLEFLFPALAKSGRSSISLHNLKFLKLPMGMDKCFLQPFINLLKCSPNLAALKIHFEECVYDDCWKIPDTAITCLTYNLKMVELIDVQGNGNELELVKFLLKNGHVLVKMSVFWRVGLEKPGKIIQKVMKFPRSSSFVALTCLEPKSDTDIFNL